MVHQYMVKSVVMWLYILVVSLLCVYVTLFRSRVSTMPLRYMGGGNVSLHIVYFGSNWV